MNLDVEVCERARHARDPRFDGRFFIAVVTTGIYCRPICPARTARRENVRYLPSAAAAERAGFRPCLRCRPEAAPGTPAWAGTGATVARALRLIDDGALTGGTIDAFAARLGVGARHLRRLFDEHVGASPHAIATTRRVQLAKRLIDETSLPLGQIASAAGFGSVRRFNDAMLRTYGRPPRALRGRRGEGDADAVLRIRLPFRPPFDWRALLAFLGARAIPGIETVDDERYVRAFELDGVTGSVTVERAPGRDALVARIDAADPCVLTPVVHRLRRLFDLGADPCAIDAVLGVDDQLAGFLERRPGVRVPGAWDGFEVGVRAILGQQISVRAATTLAGRLVARYATVAGVPRFPAPAQLAAAEPSALGLPASRARAVIALARAVDDGSIALDGSRPVPETEAALQALPGIGPWTVQYVAMRALGEPDAFPAADLGLQKAFGATPRELRRRAERWRPWRAYAAMAAWRALAVRDSGLTKENGCTTPAARARSASS